MMGQLVTLPLRISARAASFALRGTEAVLTRALAIAGRPLASEPEAAPEPPPPPPSRPRPRKPRPAPRQRQDEPGRRPADTPSPPEPPPPAAAPPAAAETRPTPPPAPPEPEPLLEEPAHVSEEAELVREEAEPGAEDGAGAEVHIDEPWDGYSKLNAKDVVARIAAASQAELAAVTLYESAHQARQSVLSAVERQLALVARGSTSN
jgi:hypothetical protein